jgi:hypothetical protein
MASRDDWELVLTEGQTVKRKLISGSELKVLIEKHKSWNGAVRIPISFVD